MRDRFIQSSVDAVYRELQRQKGLPEYNYKGGEVHPINALAVLRDFCSIHLTEDQTSLFLEAWEQQQEALLALERLQEALHLCEELLQVYPLEIWRAELAKHPNLIAEMRKAIEPNEEDNPQIGDTTTCTYCGDEFTFEDISYQQVSEGMYWCGCRQEERTE